MSEISCAYDMIYCRSEESDSVYFHIHKDKVDSTEGFNERVLKRWDATGHRKIGKLWNKEQENSE